MSNLIKSSYYVPLDDIKKVEAIRYRADETRDKGNHSAFGDPEHDADREEQLKRLQEQQAALILEAETQSRQLIDEAREEAERIVAAARSEAESWWQEQRQQDAQLQEQARQTGYEQGYEEGKAAIEQQMQEQYEALITEGRTVLEQAYEAARQTIDSAEPFLIELSSKTAEKIIGRQLELEPEWTMDMIRQALGRSNDKDTVAICVAPAQFAYVQSFRDELSYSIDAQAELHILPDASIRDHGCVIKTSFGSIDARVETQLTEIKEALLDICRRSGEMADE